VSALDDILIDVGNAAGSGNRIYTCPVALNEARNELAALRAEVLKLQRTLHARGLREAQVMEERDALRKALEAVDVLINNSHGVYGLHRNGDPSPWEELRQGGRYEEWLVDFDAALLNKEAT